MKKIAVTGTKGKTTIVRIINDILLHLGYKTISVESESIKLNGKEIFDQKYSKDVYGIIPGKCPGRFLYLGYDNIKKKRKVDFAILETVIGCYKQGLGYQNHDIGIFTNVLEDHIGSGGIKNRRDIANRKWEFISEIKEGGTLVFNYDEPLIRNKALKINCNQFPITNIENIFKKNVNGILIKDKVITIKENNNIKNYNTENNKMSIYGIHNPSVNNLGYILGGTLNILGEEIFFNNYDKIKNFLDKYEMDIYGGRMIYKEYKGRKIILDYAHEKFGLKEILDMGNKIKDIGNKLIAIIRLAPDRDNIVYKETGEYISKYADNFIVYDKIDGIDRIEYISPTGQFKRKPGEVMEILSKAIKRKNKNTQKVIYWKDAIKHGIENSKKGDVIVIIVNEPKETGLFMEEYIGYNIK